jgi:glycosyltransferase involved in cell wall biosynthesis
MLKAVVQTLSRSFEMEVVSLTELGAVGNQLKAAGIPVTALGMNRRVPDPRVILRLAKLFRRRGTNIVQTWLYHADLVGGLAARLANNVPCLWNVRNVDLDPSHVPWSTRCVVAACARLSNRLPKAIIYNSNEAARLHTLRGYAAAKALVVPNGIDGERYTPSSEARASVFAELGLPGGALVVGLIGRFHPHKDHFSFVEAAEILSRRFAKVHYVLCGEGVDMRNQALTEKISAKGLSGRFHLLGVRDDMPRIAAAFDAAVSSSIGESFSNAIGEAMACGVPCVVTDVGDSAAIVGETGAVVPPRSPQALAESLANLLALPHDVRINLGRAARRRVMERFSQGRMIQRYADIYATVDDTGE